VSDFSLHIKGVSEFGEIVGSVPLMGSRAVLRQNLCVTSALSRKVSGHHFLPSTTTSSVRPHHTEHQIITSSLTNYLLTHSWS
jgi:hypothetical protein